MWAICAERLPLTDLPAARDRGAETARDRGSTVHMEERDKRICIRAYKVLWIRLWFDDGWMELR